MSSSQQTWSVAGVNDAKNGGVDGVTERLENIHITPPVNKGGKKHKSKQTKLRSKKYKGKRSKNTRRHRK